MDLQTVAAFTLVAIVVELVPGPNFFLLARTVPNAGLAAGFGNIGGFATAFVLHGALAAFGLSAAIAASPIAFAAVKLFGGAYLMGTGTQTLFDLAGGRRAALSVTLDTAGADGVRCPRPVALAVGDGFVTNLLNPKIALFYLAAFPAFVGVAGAPHEAFSLVFVHVAVAVAWFSVVALSFARLVGAFSSPRVANALAASSGVMFVALGAGVVTS